MRRLARLPAPAGLGSPERSQPERPQELSRPGKALDRCEQTVDIVSVAFNGTINVDIRGLLSPDER
jgi:hypothetical protein